MKSEVKGAIFSTFVCLYIQTCFLKTTCTLLNNKNILFVQGLHPSYQTCAWSIINAPLLYKNINNKCGILFGVEENPR